MRPTPLRLVVLGALGLLLALAVYLAVAITRRPPALTLVAARLPQHLPRRPGRPAWPAGGQAAVAVPGVGALGTPGATHPRPIASVAKVMTAFVVLRDHPLNRASDGPEITVTADDLDTYRVEREAGESTAAVAPGEELTERQALEGLLLPSANNLAMLLARWDAGSEDAFVDEMNAEARALGMGHTHYADASGFSQATVSTARDQARLALRALRVPALAQILALPAAQLPVAGEVDNLDRLLGSDGVLGGKTGTTSAAGGCFVFRARVWVGTRSLIVVGAVLGQPGGGEYAQLSSVFAATSSLLQSLGHQLVPIGPVLRARRFGELRSPWAKPVAVRPLHIPGLIGWSGLHLAIRVVAIARLRAPIAAGQVVASAIIRAGGQRASTPLVAGRRLDEPSLGWRIMHP